MGIAYNYSHDKLRHFIMRVQSRGSKGGKNKSHPQETVLKPYQAGKLHYQKVASLLGNGFYDFSISFKNSYQIGFKTVS